MICKIAILGPGLLGGSLMLDLRQRRGVTVAAWGRRKKVIREILHKKMAHEASTDLSRIVSGADMIILCVPIGVMPRLVQQMLPYIKKNALVTDVGSVKAPVEKQLARLLEKKARWIGSHPMAGSEQAGLSAARKNLFRDATVVLTPTKATNSSTLRAAKLFWKNLGGRVVVLSPEKHDQLVAQISHLPHLMAALLTLSASKESLSLAGSGFRDTTRIAEGPAAMWREILMMNRKEVFKSLKKFVHLAQKVQRQLSSRKEKDLERFLEQAGAVRRLI
ncbi:MAG: prephenate dehydrogenase [Verrucomicrobiota bacterium]